MDQVADESSGKKQGPGLKQRGWIPDIKREIWQRLVSDWVVRF